MSNNYVIVRGAQSGVFFGRLENRDGKEVKLSSARKLYYWEGAAAVEQIAAEGVKLPRSCKFTITVESMCITDAIQIIPCTETAVEIIKAVPEWKI